MREITEDDIVKIVKMMGDYGVNYVVFGGVSLNVHGIRRGTQDIDMLIQEGEENKNNF